MTARLESGWKASESHKCIATCICPNSHSFRSNPHHNQPQVSTSHLPFIPSITIICIILLTILRIPQILAPAILIAPVDVVHQFVLVDMDFGAVSAVQPFVFDFVAFAGFGSGPEAQQWEDDGGGEAHVGLIGPRAWE